MKRWRDLLLVALGAGLTVAGADLAMQRLCPRPPHLVEAEDALSVYARSDPDVLVIGSSHSRAFFAVGDQLAERTGGARKLLAIPLEFGKLSSYAWLLEHKLRPLIEEQDASGRLRRPRLSQVILTSEWWDACAPPGGEPATNVAARAWGLGDFLSDALQHGLTDFNRNYLQERWRRAFLSSVMVQNRGQDRLIDALHDFARGKDTKDPDVYRQAAIKRWRGMIEEGAGCDHGNEKQALARILDYFKGRGIAVTLVLFPRMPETLTERAKQTTLKDYADYMRGVAQDRGLRFADMTYSTPLLASDFQEDLDHVSPDGSRKFASWALGHELAFLLEPGAVPSSRAQR